MRFPALALAAAMLAAPVAAQAYVVVPGPLKDAFGPGANIAPFGRTKLLFQSWYRGDQLPRIMPVRAVGTRPTATFSSTARTVNLEVTLGNSNATFGTLSKTFASNFSGTPTTFFPLGKISLPALGPNNPIDSPAVWIPGTAPFVYQGPHLVVQWDIQDSSTPGSAPWRADAITGTSSFAGDGPANCGGTLKTSYTSPTWSATVTGAIPSTPVSFLLGTTNNSLGGAAALPLDLGPLGLKGCTLDIEPIVAVSVNANGAGAASLNGNITVPGGTALALHAQAFHLTPNGPALTNPSAAWFGSAGLCNYLYNWTSFGPVAQFGPYPTHRSFTLFMR